MCDMFDYSQNYTDGAKFYTFAVKISVMVIW